MSRRSDSGTVYPSFSRLAVDASVGSSTRRIRVRRLNVMCAAWI
ncbi:hypothetical protein [Natronomonas gomsonensis]|nr:hypothetical protein [Natronomonas gomsonensis]